jgi:hypothetical protein
MKFGGWQRLNAEYAEQFRVETPNWSPNSEALKRDPKSGGIGDV